MFITANDPNPIDTNDDTGNNLISLAKLLKKYQLSSKQLIELIQNNQLKLLGNRKNSSLTFRNQPHSRNHCYRLTCISFFATLFEYLFFFFFFSIH